LFLEGHLHLQKLQQARRPAAHIFTFIKTVCLAAHIFTFITHCSTAKTVARHLQEVLASAFLHEIVPLHEIFVVAEKEIFFGPN